MKYGYSSSSSRCASCTEFDDLSTRIDGTRGGPRHQKSEFLELLTMTKSARGILPARSLPCTWIKPQLAKLVNQAPDGPDWIHELKLDGYRMHARLYAGKVQILTRRGNDWTDKYPAIARVIAGLPAQNAYVDGELCGMLPDGRTAFNLIQNATDTGERSWSSSSSTCCF